MYRIAIIAPPDCYRKSVVKEFMLKIKNTFGNTATILSGGNPTGVEQTVKQLALEYGMKYKEYNPAYTGKNLYSACDESYYSKGKHFTHYLHRYQMMLSNTERLVIVKQEDSRDWNSIYGFVAKHAEKKKIKMVFI